VPSGAGAQTDLFARYVAENLGKTFGQPFIVDNKPGASGDIGAMAVVKAPADGYTLLFSAASFTVVPAALSAQRPYDLQRELAPIVQIGVGGLFLAVGGDSPIKSVKELFELARREPGKLSYGTTGIGSTAHLIMASLLAQQGLTMTHVPYKSSADVLRDLNGGILQIGWVDTSSSIALVQAGKVRPLALGATMRMPATPDVPTFNELGYRHELNGWLGLFAPAGTPEPILRALNAEVNKLVHGEEGTKRLAAMNVANPPAGTPEQFAQRIRSDLQGWRKIAVDNQIKPD
jgi:tripartite-type tricarboxylate transporter receptor subunit TctC